jgi:hypothetical protein
MVDPAIAAKLAKSKQYSSKKGRAVFMLKPGAKQKRTRVQMQRVAVEEQELQGNRQAFLMEYQQMKHGRAPQSAQKQQDVSFEKDRTEGSAPLLLAQQELLEKRLTDMQNLLQEKADQEARMNDNTQALFNRLMQGNEDPEAVKGLFADVYGEAVFNGEAT